MVGLLVLIVFLLLPVPGFLMLRVYFAQRTRRLLQAAAKAPDPEGCWQCRRAGLEPIEELVFRCAGCGTIQGERAPDYVAKKRRAGFFELPAPQRREQVELLLSETDLALIRLEGEVANILALSSSDLATSGDDGRDASAEKLSRFAASLFEMRRVQQQLSDVVALVGSYTQIPTFDIDLDSVRYVLAEIHDDLLSCQRHIGELRSAHRRLAAELPLRQT